MTGRLASEDGGVLLTGGGGGGGRGGVGRLKERGGLGGRERERRGIYRLETGGPDAEDGVALTRQGSGGRGAREMGGGGGGRKEKRGGIRVFTGC